MQANPHSPQIMSGIYIHIPLCATRCIYCDFYSTTLRGREQELVTALTREMDERRDELHEPVRTIYLGGGTPSQLGWQNVQAILDAVAERFDLSACEEVTVEANPEDVAREEWHWGRVNRVSMGVQSMVDDELRLLHRRHDSQRVREAVARLREAGIANVSLDLMYGLPQQTMQSWEYSIDEVLRLAPEHISAYNLMVEEETALGRMVERGELTPCDDETCLAMARLLRQKLSAAGYVQYEISNYARPGYHARHNAAYWTQTPYLGLGPGAHSYDGARRRLSNADDLPAYLRGERRTEEELLTDTDLYNERVMLGLRTRRGIALSELLDAPVLTARQRRDAEATLHDLLMRGLAHITTAPAAGKATGAEERLSLTEAGLALGDEVMRDFFLF